MTLWYFDHRDSGLDQILREKKGWKKLFCHPNEDGNLTDCSGENISVGEGDIVIAHGGCNWKKFAEKHQHVKVYCITVGGNGLEKPKNAPENYKVSEKPWTIVNGELQDEKVRKFLTQVENRGNHSD